MRRRALVPTLAAAAGIIVGCAAAPFIVPPVRAGSNPQKWEYACSADVVAYEDDDLRKMNAMGSQGWELVALAGNPARRPCYKRPLP